MHVFPINYILGCLGRRESLLKTSQSLEGGEGLSSSVGNSKLVKWKKLCSKTNGFFGGGGNTASQMSSLLILDKLAKMSPNPQKVLSHVDHLLK